MTYSPIERHQVEGRVIGFDDAESRVRAFAPQWRDRGANARGVIAMPAVWPAAGHRLAGGASGVRSDVR